MLMDTKQYIPRLIDPKVTEYLSAFGSICIEGPKGCGKTITSLQHCNSSFPLDNPVHNFNNRNLALMDPSFILEGDTPRLINEWQEAPAIWDAVRYAVDQRGEKGQFILTGSSTPKHKGILHSGAGRIATLKMRPLSLYKSGVSSGKISLQDMFSKQPSPVLTGEVSLHLLIEHIICGGWPENVGTDLNQAKLFPLHYIETMIADDINKLEGVIRDLNKIRLVLNSLARHESRTASNRAMQRDIKAYDGEDINEETIAEYLTLFERMFVLDNQKPFKTNVRLSLRVKQSEKRHFSDPSLACALLGATEESLLGDLETLGFLFKALCVRDLTIYAEANDAKVFHYQDYNDNEIDAVVEMRDGSWGAFEIKLGAIQIDDAAKNLLRIKASIEKDPKGKPPKVLCIICGLTNAAYARPDGVYVVPITALKN